MKKLSHSLKQFFSLIFALILIITSFGCSGPLENGKRLYDTITSSSNSVHADTDNEDFKDFTQTIFKDSVSADLLTLHSYLEHPEEYNITDYDVTLGRYNLDNLDNTNDIVEYLNHLKSFKRESLSASQQITYDELKQYLETQLEYSDLYLFNTQLSTTIGIQIQLPLVFAEYTILEEKDVKDYLALLEDSDGFFQNLIDYETLRSQKGYFMEDTLANEIIEQCKTFIDSAADGFLISTFEDRLNNISDISEAAKTSYKKQNADAVNNHLIKGYNILINGLQQLVGTNRYPGGLCNYPEGDTYYKYLLKNDLGWSKSVDEFDKLVDKYLQQNISVMQHIISTNPSLIDSMNSFSFSHTEPIDILSDLKNRIANDFPAPPEVDCDIHYISKSLEDYASPAMYFTPQIDNLTNNSIYINQKNCNDNQLYATMAHEGYPGHMYQMTYFANTNPDPIRYILEPIGFVEGWATYCELYSYSYADTKNTLLNALAQTNYATILCLYAKMDLGVNYYKWTLNDLTKYLTNYGYDENTAREVYYSIVSEPGNYCKYVLGYIGFSELKSEAQQKLGDSFNIKDFHEFIMNIGPVSFDTLNKRLDAWIETAQYK